MTPLSSPLVFFSKHWPTLSIEAQIERARQLGFEGFDLCCRRGHPVNQDNIRTALPKAAELCRRAGLVVSLLSGDFELLEPTHPTAEPILGAMQEAGVRRVRLGFFVLDNATDDYWEKVDYVRRQFDGWAKLGERFGVTVCYHTHSTSRYLGLSAGSMMHLVQGFDPRWIGVILDPGHLLLDGEHPDIAVNMTKKYLTAVALKDSRKAPNPVGPGWQYCFCRAGYGDVDWENVFANLRRVHFAGPLSIQGEYDRSYPPGTLTEPLYLASLTEEVKFFAHLRATYLEA